MIKGFLDLPWFVWTGLAFVIAVIYSFVWPRKAVAVHSGFRFFIVRWGHALTWLLLTLNFILRGLSPALEGVANLIAFLGALLYALFILMTFVIK